MLLPEGLLISPYAILDFDATLVLEDARGLRGTFRRRQTIRFLQDGISGILDHCWGDGVSLAFYENEAGTLLDSFKDEGRRHLVVGLKRAMARGEVLTFEVVRRVVAQFTEDEEWLETIVDHPIGRLAYGVVFPRGRPCRAAVLCSGESKAPLSVFKLADGRTVVRFGLARPRPETPYTVRWSW